MFLKPSEKTKQNVTFKGSFLYRLRFIIVIIIIIKRAHDSVKHMGPITRFPLSEAVNTIPCDVLKTKMHVSNFFLNKNILNLLTYRFSPNVCLAVFFGYHYHG